MKRKFILLIIAKIFTVPIFAQKPFVGSFINHQMDKLHIPGFEAVAIKGGEIVWTGYYGYQNLENKIPVTIYTLFEAVSTSKTVTAAVIMQLYAAEKFNIDEGINKYLISFYYPISVQKPADI